MEVKMGKDRISRIIAALVLFACASTNPIFAKYSGGSGQPTDPYLISTPADLNDIGNHPEDFALSFLMTADINMAQISGNEYRVIGSESTPFTGVFDGTNHIISNTSRVIFGSVYGDNAAIKNLGLINVNVPDGGALAVYFDGMNTGTISDCYVKGGTVTGSSAGGLINGGGSGKIINCHTTCEVQSTQDHAAGITCFWSGNSIDYCSSSGNITSAGAHCGGIVGENWGGHIYRCYSTGDISSSGFHTGGIAGLTIGGTIEQSWSTSDIIDTGPDGATGGLAGVIDSWGGVARVINCYAKGTVTGAGNYTGGLVGRNWAFGGTSTIENCYSSGYVSGQSGFTGGLIGLTTEDNGGTASCIASFWDVNTSNQPTSAGGTGKTTSEMQTQSTFTSANWNFSTPVWKIYNNRSYPYLAWEKYGGGAGNAQSPYRIWTIPELLAMAADINDYDKHFVLMNDIDLDPCLPGGQVFATAVITATQFTGVFDGDDHKIANLTISGTGDLGLFGHITGEVKNLGLENVSVTGASDSLNIGTLAAYNGGIISNCFSTGNVAAGDFSFNIGGLAGLSDGVITHCFSASSVVGGDYIQNLGGFVGAAGFGSISNCFSTGPVSCGDSAFDIGGFAGASGEMSEPYITNCYSTGNVNANGSPRGGFIGQNQGHIVNCCSTGNVNSGGDGTGGFAGSENFNGDIINSFYLDTAGPHNGHGEPLTDAQMKQQSSFTGWDFVCETANGTNDLWAIREDVSCPELAWQLIFGDYDNSKTVDFADFASMGLKWQQADPTFYCGGADLTGDEWVDLYDLALLCDNWLEGL